MCGIIGFIGHNKAAPRETLRRMTESLSHRGPDDEGSWFDERHQVGLGHRRLSILDLSEQGRQPMVSSDGRYVIVFNGEIYNFRDIRKELEAIGHAFRSNSDTEVILASVQKWGVLDAVRHLVGMFAFALWDRTGKFLYLVRDRIGIKPFYYCQTQNVFLFASELKALHYHPDFVAEIDRDALLLYTQYAYIPAPRTIFQGVRKLPPAHIIAFDPAHKRISSFEYWSPRAVHGDATNVPLTGSLLENAAYLEDVIQGAVQRHMISDVPVGAFLSGGVDSSLVVAMMQKRSRRPVDTFTIGFREVPYNEAAFARKIAEFLGTNHHELILSPKDALEVIPLLSRMYDEPFADPSQVPTYLVSKLARSGVKVVLSGDGGDELFGGYTRYARALRAWKMMKCFPASLRKRLSQIYLKATEFFFSRDLRVVDPLDLRRCAELFQLEDVRSLYFNFLELWNVKAGVVRDAVVPATWFTQKDRWIHTDDDLRWMMFLDLVTYLPDDILTKVDRASMSVSLEVRVPLLDHLVVEAAAKIPTAQKMRGNTGKLILRTILGRHVPAKLFERPKTGFGLPVCEWLREDLREWAESLLTKERLKVEGFFDVSRIRQMWSEHLRGLKDWSPDLWIILMFEAWLGERGKNAVP